MLNTHTYSGISRVSACTMSQVTCVLLSTRRRRPENASAAPGSRLDPLSGFILRLRKSRLGMLHRILLIYREERKKEKRDRTQAVCLVKPVR